MAEDTSTLSEIQLGFLEESDGAWFEPRFFPSKVGGRPAWINQEHMPTSDTLKCGVCSDPLCFLLQIYSPLSSNNDAYHRMLYVFCCRRGSCLKRNSFKVFRAQLPRENPFFSDTEEDLADLDEPPEENTTSTHYRYRKQHSTLLCTACGQPGAKKCGSCLSTSYCGPIHQKLHWTLGQHAKNCAALKATAERPATPTKWTENNPLLFKEFELITEPEEDVKRKRNQDLEEVHRPMLEKYHQEMAEEAKNGNDEGDDMDTTDLPSANVDPQWRKFQTVTDVDSTQVVRYTTGKGEPLWMCTAGMKRLEDVPKCALCGSERIFELEILPQIIYKLEVKQNLPSGDTNEEIDFGVLIVYTCKNSCHVNPTIENRFSSGSYAVEYIYQQKYE